MKLSLDLKKRSILANVLVFKHSLLLFQFSSRTHIAGFRVWRIQQRKADVWSQKKLLLTFSSPFRDHTLSDFELAKKIQAEDIEQARRTAEANQRRREAEAARRRAAEESSSCVLSWCGKSEEQVSEIFSDREFYKFGNEKNCVSFCCCTHAP